MTTNHPEGSSSAGTPDRSGDDGGQHTSQTPHGPDSPGYHQPGEPAVGEPGPRDGATPAAAGGAPYGQGAVPPPPASAGQGWQQQAGYGGHPGYGAPADSGAQAGYAQGQPGGYAQGQPGGYGPSQPGGAPPYGAYQQGQYGPGPGYGQPGYQGGQQIMSDADQRLWATLSHLSALIFPLLGPLVIWLVLRERGAFVEDQSKEALNFNITLVILGVVISIVSVITLGFGAILFLYYVAALFFVILAAVAANRGERYRYPLTLRLVN